MMRTPDAFAHSVTLVSSDPVSVMLYRPFCGSVSVASSFGTSTMATRSPFSGSVDQRTSARWFLPKYAAMSSSV